MRALLHEWRMAPIEVKGVDSGERGSDDRWDSRSCLCVFEKEKNKKTRDSEVI